MPKGKYKKGEKWRIKICESYKKQLIQISAMQTLAMIELSLLIFRNKLKYG